MGAARGAAGVAERRDAGGRGRRREPASAGVGRAGTRSAADRRRACGERTGPMVGLGAESEVSRSGGRRGKSGRDGRPGRAAVAARGRSRRDDRSDPAATAGERGTLLGRPAAGGRAFAGVVAAWTTGTDRRAAVAGGRHGGEWFLGFLRAAACRRVPRLLPPPRRNRGRRGGGSSASASRAGRCNGWPGDGRNWCGVRSCCTGRGGGERSSWRALDRRPGSA